MIVQTAHPLLRLLVMLAGLALVGVAFIVGAVLVAVFLGAAMVMVVIVTIMIPFYMKFKEGLRLVASSIGYK